MRFETHCHSEYSNIRLIDCINKLKDIILTANEKEYKGVALTDHEALCGHVEWLQLEQSLKKENKIPKDFKCALGNEIYLVDERKTKQKYFHFILIAKNTIGWKALRELSSYAWLNSYRDRRMERVPTLKQELEDIVNKYPNTLIATSACLGSELDTLVLSLIEAEKKQNQEEIYLIKLKIDNFIKWIKELFKEDFYIEIAPGSSKEQKLFNSRIKNIAKFYNCKIVLGTDAHYLRKNDRFIHKSFLNSKDGEREVDEFYQDCYLMNDEEAYEKIKDNFSKKEFEQIRLNSLEIYDKIEEYNIFHNPIIPVVKVKTKSPIFDNSLKDYPILQMLKNHKDEQRRQWINICLDELVNRKLYNKEYLERLELEADVIEFISNKLENNLFAYFNTFRHYIDLFWECGSMVGPGRGSAGSFLSNYLLGITQIDPIQWNLPYFRFLNKDRAELPDIDIDLAPSKRPLILKKIREERGQLNVVQVATFGTEGTKAAIACACRGYRTEEYPQGIDNDIALYLSSLIPVERGFLWSLKDCLEGNEEKNRKPIKELIFQLNKYPGLTEIIYGIEGLVCRRGQHASGIILYNNSPYDTTALMRSPNGDITTQFDLHKSEALGDTKFDFLVTEVCDKIITTIKLLQQDGYFKEFNSLREIYNNLLHPSVINLKDKKIWDALANGTVQDVFQFNTQIGIETAKLIKPSNPIEMTSANALLRLTAQEGQERPINRYVRFKNNVKLWYEEMDKVGLTKEEQKILEPYYLRDFGVPASQEQLMLCVMDKNISNFTLAESNMTRKVLAKKQIQKIPEVKEKFLNQCPSKKLGEYVWKTMMLPQMSYSFSEVHALLYSFIGIQTLILATNFPSMYWDCACLIVNSGGTEEEEEEDLDINTDIDNEEIEDDNDEEDETKKKKTRTINFGKIAIAIGKMKSMGIEITSPNINKSSYTFSPDVENNIIRYGLNGITRVGQNIVYSIIENRPYISIEDFLSKVKVNKPQMINLIKSGAFDDFGDRVQIMKEYINLISDTKKRLTLQNMRMLIEYELLPSELEHQIRVFNFNKYLKSFKNGIYYDIDEIALRFLDENYSIDNLYPSDNGMKIKQTDWDKIYKKEMNPVRDYIKEHQEELLDKLNNKIINLEWNKYCEGNVSKWEMDSISCYLHEHELYNVNEEDYNCINFFRLPEEPVIDQIINIKGKQIPLFKINRIMGTVLDKNKTKKTVTLLTKNGVVTVKIFGDVFNYYDKQISEKNPETGKKKVLEKSIFSRGNKIIVTGIRRDDNWIAKKYSRTPYHLVEQITKIDEDGKIKIKTERIEQEEIK